MKEETIFYSLDNAKSPKGKRLAPKQVRVKFEEQRKKFFDYSLRPFLIFSGNMKQLTSYLTFWKRQNACIAS